MQEQLWQNICTLAQIAGDKNRPIPTFVSISLTQPEVRFDDFVASKDQLVVGVNGRPPKNDFYSYSIENQLGLFAENKNKFPPGLEQWIQNYLPFAILPFEARIRKKTLAIAHFAQSLDGKIATFSGDSKWIGNAQNLDHTHRLRALCDGILVGRNTVRYDRPRLTVRRVSGRSPIRIILGASPVDLSSLTESSDEPIWNVSSEKLENLDSIKGIQLPKVDGRIDGKSIMESLFENGINTLLVEGGAKTTSGLLQDNALHILQLHLAPIIFGSGKSGIQLPQIESVKEGRRFLHHYQQKMGDGFMFTGLLAD